MNKSMNEKRPGKPAKYKDPKKKYFLKTLTDAEKEEVKQRRMEKAARSEKCPYSLKCGGCDLQGTRYERQLSKKHKRLTGLLEAFAEVKPVIGMKDPLHYRNKVHHAFKRDRSGNVFSGPYEKNSHWVINVDHCMIEDQKSQEIIHTIRKLVKTCRIRIYDEDTDQGVLRHVLLRRGFTTGEIMVVLVSGIRKTPDLKFFVSKLRAAHPEITTILLNVNAGKSSMILGSEPEKILYGPGCITDVLCGKCFRISAKSFYQVNPVQTEKLYSTAIEFAGLKGDETVIDAYCGIGTIGICAAEKAGQVIGVELNPDAVKDAEINASANNISNIRFVNADAGKYMRRMAAEKKHADVVFMDPPRSGSTEEFMASAISLAPSRIVYVSCGPDTLARDLKYMSEHGYQVKRIQPVDMFPYTDHVETVCLLVRENITFSLPTDSIPSHTGGYARKKANL